ncbi:MAG: 6-hydroxymethylpterin diphosphokinase MptE-like protein [Campylobacterota bacterium]
MQNINEHITKNFNANISYIQANHKELFLKLSSLDSAIEQGHYKERYELVYENNNFDVLEKNTQNYLYNKKSSKYATQTAKSVDHELNDNLFLGFHQQKISDNDLKKYSAEPLLEHHMSGFAPIIHYTQKNHQENKTLKSIDKFIFFGTGLGLHIDTIHKKISSKVYFIIEDDLELFRLSLFTVNYQNIATKATIIFSIFEVNDEFLNSADLFLKTKYYYNHYLKFFQMLNHSDDKRKQFHIAITSQSHSLFFYNSLLTQYIKPLDYIFDNYKFLNDTLEFSDEILDNKPFLLVAAGPSLQKNIEWLKQNHNNYIVVALSATLSYLEKEKISPDIITHLDAFDGATVHFEKVNSFDFIKNSICVFSSRTPTKITSKFKKEQLFFFETGTNYKKDSLKASAPCIGSLTYQLMLTLKVKNLYLLGLDLSIDNATGKTHSDSHEYVKTLELKENAFENSLMTYKDSLFNVEGNLHENVLTTPHFKSSIDTINYSTQLRKQENQLIYNLSDGAKFKETIPTNIKDIKTTKQTNNIELNCLQQLCDKYSSSNLEIEDEKRLKSKLLHSEKLHETILTLQNTQLFAVDELLNNLEKFSSAITLIHDIKEHEINRVIDTYLRYILSYIFDFYNTQEQTDIDYKEINHLLTKHLLEMVDYYHNSIQTKLEEKRL